MTETTINPQPVLTLTPFEVAEDGSSVSGLTTGEVAMLGAMIHEAGIPIDLLPDDVVGIVLTSVIDFFLDAEKRGILERLTDEEGKVYYHDLSLPETDPLHLVCVDEKFAEGASIFKEVYAEANPEETEVETAEEE